MTGGRTVAALGGFLAGSAVTVMGIYYLNSSEARRDAAATSDATSGGKNDGDDANAPSTTRSRGLRGVGAPASAPVQSRNVSAVGAAASGEQINFLSGVTKSLWSYLRVAGADMVREMMEPMFKDMMPGPLATLRFIKLDFGRVPFRFDNVMVHDLKDGTVQFDMDIVWDGDCDIELKADHVPKFGVKNIKLCGRMQFLMKPLTNVIPCVGAVQYAFINPPVLKLDFTGLASIADFSVIDKNIRRIMQDTMASMVVLPQRMMYKMDLACDFLDAYVPQIGVARITAVSGRGFQVEKKVLGKGDIPDVYLNITLGGKLWKTSVVKDNLQPEWNETADFVLSDHDQIIKIHAWDEDKGALDADDDLGIAQVTVGELMLAGKTLQMELQQDNKGTGAFVTLHCDICNLSSTNVKSLEKPPAANHLGGLLTILVTQANDLPVEKEKAASFIKVTYGSKYEFVTSEVLDGPGIDALNPFFDAAFHVPLTPALIKEGLPPVVFELFNGKKVLGKTEVKHSELLALPDNKTLSEKRKIGTGGASIEFRVSLCGVESVKRAPASSLRGGADVDASDPFNQSLGGTAAPEGAPAAQKVRVTVVSGSGFQVKKKMFKKDDVPDAYCNVKFGSSPKVWRTATIKNNISPVWNESSDYAISNRNQVISVEVCDANRKDEDDIYGSFRITVGQLLLSGGPKDVEIEANGKGTGCFIQMRCDMV